ncbi:ATP-dependent helicase HrpB [Poseidonocella sedimentorum]|uniref:ATP-dependent helicase HrpB n=1 Tax=Poseidonocella sedimentorum TaxID=871652 RepID=A0A1I6E654_9RHOB|nr:ATP-dependent helicase HrpB [Poseidonocella sedimentorum]SFR13031.1 ATP-dependent helicase HrpB [Poseidonocella sedimentorum]
MADTLPIHAILDDLIAAMAAGRRAVLQAPPGAGKTTVVPLALLRAGITSGTILMLEPRRLAARAAAERMAENLSEPVGQTVGYRMRGEARVSRATRIEVVTEGILTRRIQSDPGLDGVGAVIFDEFHERSLNADFGLALCLEIAGALRDDLHLLAMSATLDAAPVAALMDAPILTAEGRSFPVETIWIDAPLPPRTRLPEAAADLVAHAAAETAGDMLVFLPGEGEIRRTAALLGKRLPPDHVVQPLFGAMDFSKQRAALSPLARGRKIVLATAIAETSLTIPGITTVVDAGRARRARFDPANGMSRLVTERVTRAEATQRAGRAGRTGPGRAYRLWTRGEEGALAPFPPPEIETADLAPLALDLAAWGAEPADLPFLAQPNPGALAEARALLRLLGALDRDDRITAHGRALAALPLHPRLAHMLSRAGKAAAPLAALLGDRDPLSGAPVDLALRLEALQDAKAFAARRPYALNRGALERIRAEARRLAALAPPPSGEALSPAAMAALAYPDRIALRRKGAAPRYQLSSGSGAVLDEADPLAGQRLLVATSLDGDRREARIRQALPIAETELRALFGDLIAWDSSCAWSRRSRLVEARRQERLGALALDDRIWQDAPPETIARALLDGVRDLGLPWTDAARRFQARALLLRDWDQTVPDLSDAALLGALDDWLLPHLTGLRSAEDIRALNLLPALRAILTWEQSQALDRTVPPAFTTPLGRKIPIDYSGEHPAIALRLQEMFGQTTHPTSAGRPLRITLLSPAQRPVQVTMDLPAFWQNSYADVRKDMRGRYPKHPWPEDPSQADPTLRAKPRRG